MLLPDPLGKFSISTQLFVELVERVLEAGPCHVDGTPRLLVLGGGGYHPLMLARCWTGVWAALSGRALPLGLPPRGRALLEAVDWDMDEEDEEYYASLFESRCDPGREGALREDVGRRLDMLRRTHPLFLR